MQLTRFDRWLRKKFVYELHIHTLRPPESLPAGVRAVDLPEVTGRRYKHLYIARSNRAADQLIQQLKENSQMYTSEVVDRKAWYVPFIAPKNKSVSWWLFSAAVISVAAYFALIYIKSLVDDPELRRNFEDALRVLRG